MKHIEKIIIDTDKKLIHIFFKQKTHNISYEYSNRFKLVVDTINRRSKNENENEN